MTKDVLNFQKDLDAPLRLVPERSETTEPAPVEQQFVSFMFLRVNPEWRKLKAAQKDEFRAEFATVFQSFGSDLLTFCYSLVGFDSKADLMLWRVGTSLDLVQDMTAKLYRTEVGGYLETVDNYLSVTKKMMFVDHPSDDRYRVQAGTAKYHFVYPCSKRPEWYEIPAEERDAMIEESFMVGKKFPNIKIHLTHTFGFTDNEYLISFETDEPRDFLALAEELRQTRGSRLTLRGMPVYTCRRRSLLESLEAIG